MANKTDKNSYTILFAIVMVVIVGSLLAGFASGLKPRIKANEKFEKQQNILYAMGINNNEGTGDVAFISTDNVAEVFNKYITKQLVVQGDQATENDLAYLIDIKKESTIKIQNINSQSGSSISLGPESPTFMYTSPVTIDIEPKYPII